MLNSITQLTCLEYGSIFISIRSSLIVPILRYPNSKAQYMMIRNVFIATIFSVSALVFFVSGITPAWAASIEVPRISVEQTRSMLGKPDVIIIDVRTTKTWWKSPTKISHAVREELGSMEQWANKYSKSSTLIFYCT